MDWPTIGRDHTSIDWPIQSLIKELMLRSHSISAFILCVTPRWMCASVALVLWHFLSHQSLAIHTKRKDLNGQSDDQEMCWVTMCVAPNLRLMVTQLRHYVPNDREGVL